METCKDFEPDYNKFIEKVAFRQLIRLNNNALKQEKATSKNKILKAR